MKLFCTAYFHLKFGFEIYWQKNIDAKAAYKMLGKMTTGSGSILGAILKVMDLYNLNENSRQDPLTFHRFVEACKFAYAQRSKIGDWTNSELRESIEQVSPLLLLLTIFTGFLNVTHLEGWVENVNSQNF